MRSWTNGSVTVQAEKIARYGALGPEVVTIAGETVRVAPDFLSAPHDLSAPYVPGEPVGNYCIAQAGIAFPYLQDAASFEAAFSPI